MLIDTHVHLNNPKFKDNLDEVINRALQNDVKMMIVVGYDDETNDLAIKIAEQYPFIFATVGYHPTEAHKINARHYERLVSLLKHDKVVGIGECGMDLYWDKDYLTEQIEVFRFQIELSLQYDMPLIIHMRDATEVTYNVLKDYKNLKGIMHCYSGSAEMASQFINLGLHISLGGPVTFKNGHKPKEVAKIVPLDKLLIETDAPFLSPHPYRGKTNEPAMVKIVAEEIALIKEIPYNEIAKITTANALKLFGIKETN